MLITVLVPVYNVAQFLPNCLDSILNQSYEKLQIVLIDDGSKDNSWEIMQEYASKDDRIEIYKHNNQGVAYTRNCLLEKVKGEYVLFIDSDDWIEHDMLEYLSDRVLETKADVIACQMMINNQTPTSDFSETLYDRTDIIKKFLLHNELRGSLCNKLIKSTLLHGLSFDNSIGYGEDALFCWQIFQRVDNVLLTTKQLYHYRMNDNSISHSKFGQQKLTGHTVWQQITNETLKNWPYFSDISQARWGMEDMYLLRQAGLYNYKKDEKIVELQETVSRFLPQMKSSGLLKGKDVFNAVIMSRWYGFNIVYGILYRMKMKLK